MTRRMGAQCNDDVVRLREWGTDRVFLLFWDQREPFTIGTAAICTIRIQDQTGRRHPRSPRGC
jgi:hypothetical protein